MTRFIFATFAGIR